MTDKERLIEAVKKYRAAAKDDLTLATARKDKYGVLGAETTIFDCQHFLKLIEEILP